MAGENRGQQGAQARREDVRMKIPALLHLSRLGYAYLPRKGVRRDPETNILPEILRASVARINGTELAEATFQRLLADLRTLAGAEDLGEDFHLTIRNGWNGLKLLDFDHPAQNVFHAGTEIPCGTGRRRFRPDLTFFINGLPLAMMEVKALEQRGGMLSEYDRMRRRFRQESFRPFLQESQLWLFSSGAEPDMDALLPRNGTFFTAGSRNEFPVYPGPGKAQGGMRCRKRIPPETERRILEDNGMPGFREDPAYRGLVCPDTPAHRMLTGLMAPDRFLFLIRYGIRFRRPAGAAPEDWQKKILTWDELEALRTLEGKIRRGFRNWTVPCARAERRLLMGAAVIRYLQDHLKGCRMIWAAADGEEARRTEKTYAEMGLRPEEIRVLEAETLRSHPLEETRTPEGNGRTVCFLAEPSSGYRTGKTLVAVLRRADPEAILIRLGKAEIHERENYTYLLRCADGTLYCGWTNDLARRVQTHNAGKGARYTRSRLPVELVYAESWETREEAMRREWQIKQMTRAEKERLIREKKGEE